MRHASMTVPVKREDPRIHLASVASRKLTPWMRRTSPTVVQRRIAVAAAICVMAFALVGVRLVDVDAAEGPGFGSRRPSAANAAWPAAPIFSIAMASFWRATCRCTISMPNPPRLSNKDQAAQGTGAGTGASVGRLDRIFASKHRYVLVDRQLSPDVQSRVMRLGPAGPRIRALLQALLSQGAMPPCRSSAPPIPTATAFPASNSGLDKRLRAGNPGEGVKLSLDMRVQYALAQEVEKSREEFSRPRRRRHRHECRHRRSPGHGLAAGRTESAPPDAWRRSAPQPHGCRTSTSSDRCSRFSPSPWRWRITPIKLDEQIPIGNGLQDRPLHHPRCREDAGLSLGARCPGQIVQYRHRADRAALRRRAAEGVSCKKLGLLSAVDSRLPERAAPLYPSQLGRHRDRDHRFRPGHFGDAAVLRPRGGRSGQWRAPHRRRPSSVILRMRAANS